MQSEQMVTSHKSTSDMATIESIRESVRGAAAHVPAGSKSAGILGRVGDWQLVRQLAEGNLTRVYLARPATSRQTQLGSESGEEAATPSYESDADSQGTPYVIKLLRKEWWRDSQAIEMQRRDAWVGMRVSHPNLLPVLSASVKEPPFFVVSPRLEGLSLANLLAERGPLAVPLALWIARQTAEALDALARTAGVIHTDVTPANIVVSPHGHATLIDFGLVQTPYEASQWRNRPLAGTLGYMAPEMLTSALSADGRSDLYSLGVVLFEMLAGRRPWDSDDPSELTELHRSAKAPDIRDLRPETPAAVAELVAALVAKDPLRRPTSAEELAARLTRLEIDSFSLR
jgi:serine/threonine-protein kinase